MATFKQQSLYLNSHKILQFITTLQKTCSHFFCLPLIKYRSFGHFFDLCPAIAMFSSNLILCYYVSSQNPSNPLSPLGRDVIFRRLNLNTMLQDELNDAFCYHNVYIFLLELTIVTCVCFHFVAGTTTRSTTTVKDDQELLAKVGQLLESQLRIWRDFAQLVRKNPDSISKVQEDLIKRIKVGAGT